MKPEVKFRFACNFAKFWMEWILSKLEAWPMTMHPGAYKNGFVLFNVTNSIFSWEYLFYGHYLNVLNDLSWMYWMPFPECTEWPFLNVLNDLSWVYWMTFPKCTEWPFLNVLNDLSWMYWMTFPECTEWPFQAGMRRQSMDSSECVPATSWSSQRGTSSMV